MKKTIIGLLIILTVTACSPAVDSVEGRKNAIEQYLLTLISEQSAERVPSIFNLESSEKSAVVNALDFEVVKHSEAQLIAYLDMQWPDWRDDEGFITSYVKNFETIKSKVEQSLKDDRQTRQIAISCTTIDDFETALSKALTQSGRHLLEDLFINDTGTVYTWQVQAGNASLQATALHIFDMRLDEYYDCTYQDGTLLITPAPKNELVLGHIPLIGNDDNALLAHLLPLLNAEQNAAATMKFSTNRANISSEQLLIAVRTNTAYQPVESLEDGSAEGFLQISWQLDDKVQEQHYALYKSQTTTSEHLRVP